MSSKKQVKKATDNSEPKFLWYVRLSNGTEGWLFGGGFIHNEVQMSELLRMTESEAIRSFYLSIDKVVDEHQIDHGDECILSKFEIPTDKVYEVNIKTTVEKKLK